MRDTDPTPRRFSGPANIVIGVAGGTGSGKTTVARNIGAALPQGSCVVLEHDAYYKDLASVPMEERLKVNYDHPDSLENDLLLEHLDLLKAGHPFEQPVYDFASHTRAAETQHVDPTPIVIVEGILVFVDPRLRDRFDIKLFVDTDPDLRVVRRIRRDMEKRGRTFEQVRAQYYATVRPMHIEFVEPSKRWADLVIPEGGENRVALDLVIGKLLNALGA